MRTLVLLTLVSVLVGGAAPAWAEPPGVQTVAEWRAWIAMIEETYDARVGRTASTFYAAGAAAEGYLWSDCLRPQTVGELSAWLRTTAPPELTLLQALRLNAREHGCWPRDQADTDADLAIRSGPAGQRR